MDFDNVIHFPRKAAVSRSSREFQQKSEGFDIRGYLPEGESCRFIETSQGSHHIPHIIYEFMFKATHTKVELLIFACLLRFTLGFHRSECKASLTFISEWTGLAVPNVKKGLDLLLKRSLIKRIEGGTRFHEAAVYEVPVVKGYLAHQTKSEIQENGELAFADSEVQKPEELLLNQVENSYQINNRSIIDSISKKDIRNIEGKKTLTLETKIPEYLESYLANLKPARKKRESKTISNPSGMITASTKFQRRFGFLLKKEFRVPARSVIPR